MKFTLLGSVEGEDLFQQNSAKGSFSRSSDKKLLASIIITYFLTNNQDSLGQSNFSLQAVQIKQIFLEEQEAGYFQIQPVKEKNCQSKR